MASTKYKKNYRGRWETLIWDGTYTENGAKHRKRIVSDKSSADLERRVNEFKASVQNQDSTVFSDMTFTEYAWRWFEASKAAKEENTKAMYKNVIKVHLSFLSDVRMSEIRHSHFQQAINNQLNHPRTCQQICITFKQIIRSAAKDRILPKSAIDDVLSDISMPKYQKPNKRPLSPLEKEAFFNAQMDERKTAFVSILYFCGLRRGEAVALTPDDFDWQRKEVSVSKVIVFDKNSGQPQLKPYPKSNNGIRRVPIPDAAIGRMQPFIESCSTGFIFHGENTEMMTLSAYTRMWDSIISHMNIAAGYNPNAKRGRKEKPIQGLTAHTFRHNYCTELCYQVPKISTKMIARLLGDTEKMVLEIYSHIVEEREDLADAINDALK